MAGVGAIFVVRSKIVLEIPDRLELEGKRALCFSPKWESFLHLIALSVRGRGGSYELFKSTIKGRQAVKTGIKGDCGYGYFFVVQKALFRLLNTVLVDKIVEVLLRILIDDFRSFLRTDTCQFTDTGKGNIRFEI